MQQGAHFLPCISNTSYRSSIWSSMPGSCNMLLFGAAKDMQYDRYYKAAAKRYAYLLLRKCVCCVLTGAVQLCQRVRLHTVLPQLQGCGHKSGSLPDAVQLLCSLHCARKNPGRVYCHSTSCRLRGTRQSHFACAFKTMTLHPILA